MDIYPWRHREIKHYCVIYYCDQHLAALHKPVVFICNQCSYKAKWKSSLKGHVETQHDGFIYNYDECSYKGKTKDMLNNM